MLKILVWPQQGGHGLYCPEHREGLGAASDEVSTAHLAHVHVVREHDNVEWEFEEVPNLETAIAKAAADAD